ncbi:hypothetical protein NX02_24285 [Sphingomonas sanxanigenens DSM 19645 = NX02]|uniref:Uncharacterized protein n=1 Tax=Sphingomonas sanxanigenens DSM 19645 = NX02 TaxID=1123269 RepID=W0AEY6_9SPHN|nr:hypothetical protein NX02_24285 [Sphingomonas sanxanigenens DSM 19645 = NX02]
MRRRDAAQAHPSAPRGDDPLVARDMLVGASAMRLAQRAAAATPGDAGNGTQTIGAACGRSGARRDRQVAACSAHDHIPDVPYLFFLPDDGAQRKPAVARDG